MGIGGKIWGIQENSRGSGSSTSTGKSREFGIVLGSLGSVGMEGIFGMGMLGFLGWDLRDFWDQVSEFHGISGINGMCWNFGNSQTLAGSDVSMAAPLSTSAASAWANSARAQSQKKNPWKNSWDQAG